MIKFLSRHNKDYSRYNIVKDLTKDIKVHKDIFILLPFSKNQFLKHFLKRSKIINDFFISNYDTYVHDRKKISKHNPRAWWKYFQDWFNFKHSKYLISDTQCHFQYWERLFGKYQGRHFVLPVLADKNIYFPSKNPVKNKKIKILFYGSFIPLHGIDTILKAFKILEDKDLDFEAHILGTGQIYKQMSDLHKNLVLKNVQMNGKILPEKELSDEIRKSDIVLGIFGSSTKALSVIPNKVYQALACKKALISMETEAIKEFFSEKDLLFCKNTENSLAEAMFQLSKDHTKRKQLASHGHKSFINLYEKSKKSLERLILEVAQKTSGAKEQ